MRSILFVLGALLLAGCGGQSGGSTPVQGGGEFIVDRVETGGALLGVWGTSATNVWAGGGQSDRALILHGDGNTWTPVDTDGATSLIWNMYGFSPEDVYAVGEHGLVLHFDGVRWQHVATHTDRNLYGLWGPSGDEVWTVGGAPSGAPGSAVILRRQGNGDFQPVTTIPEQFFPDVFYKIYGMPQGGIIVVGDGGTALHFDGSSWKLDPVPTTKPIISLWGRGNELFAVGGFDAGMVLHWDGSSWGMVQGLGFTPGLNGVFTAPGQPVFAVGGQSSIVEIGQNAKVSEQQAPVESSRNVLHGVWGDKSGTVFSVGGDLDRYPGEMGGVILRRN